MKQVAFYKDEEGWFAEVAGHTKAQNRMVAGADKFLEKMSGGHRRLRITVAAGEAPVDGWFAKLTRVEHDPFGATYLCRVKGWLLPRIAWLCNVTHTVFGEHPRKIWITEVAFVDNEEESAETCVGAPAGESLTQAEFERLTADAVAKGCLGIDRHGKTTDDVRELDTVGPALRDYWRKVDEADSGNE